MIINCSVFFKKEERKAEEEKNHITLLGIFFGIPKTSNNLYKLWLSDLWVMGPVRFHRATLLTVNVLMYLLLQLTAFHWWRRVELAIRRVDLGKQRVNQEYRCALMTKRHNETAKRRNAITKRRVEHFVQDLPS